MQFGQTYVEDEASDTLKELMHLFNEVLEADDMTKIDYVNDQANQVLSRWSETLKNWRIQFLKQPEKLDKFFYTSCDCLDLEN